MDFGDQSSGFADLKIPWIADQLKVLARFLDSVSLEVRIVDRIINFRSALVNVLVFCRLTFHFRGFRKRLPRYPTHTVYMYSSIDSVTEMTSGNLVHGSCMVTHGSGNGGNNQ